METRIKMLLTPKELQYLAVSVCGPTLTVQVMWTRGALLKEKGILCDANKDRLNCFWYSSLTPKEKH
jgi:hypothetical protein